MAKEDLEDQPDLDLAEPEQTKEVAKRIANLPVEPLTPQGMLSVIVQDLNMAPEAKLALIKEMIALQNAVEDRAAKKEFELHFATMQGDFKPVPRTKTARDNEKNRDLYDFAPIEEIVKTNGWAISKHGFSYSFREEAINEGSAVRFFITIKGWGHSEETYVDLPIGGAKAPLMNGAQGARGLQSYGQRYAMIAGFGFVMEDDDDDGAGYDDGVNNAEAIRSIREVKSHAELKTLYPTLIKNQDERTRMILNKEAGAKSKALRDAGITE